MGVKINAQSNSTSDFVIADRKMCNIAVDRTRSLMKFYNITYPYTETYSVEKENVTILHTYTENVIKMRKNELKTKTATVETDNFGRKKKMAFLDLLLQTTVDGEPLSHETIRDEVNTFMFAVSNPEY